MTSKPAREYKGVATKKGSSSASGSLLELILIVAVALGLALGIQAFLVKPYRIPSESMVPTLQIGQRVLVNRIGARFTTPDVGDVVVFHPPAGAEQDNTCGSGQPPAGTPCDKPTADRADVNFIKRIVAGPGTSSGSTTARSCSTASSRRSRSPSPVEAVRDATSRPRSRFRPITTS